MSRNSDKVTLSDRELHHVKRFWKESQDQELGQLFPFQNHTLEEAIDLYHQSLEPDTTSYGKTIYVKDCYIGDVWCYCIDEKKEKLCFISIVVFDKAYWKRGIGTRALHDFMDLIINRYSIEKICAFTYQFNKASIMMLERVGFKCIEEFIEDGVKSLYYEYRIIGD